MLFRRERRQSDISIHAPARGATPLSWGGVQEMSISIHAPARGATVRCRFPTTATAYFNPRPREGGDRRKNHRLCAKIISIHAPARGATTTLKGAPEGSYISIHAPARGATRAMRREETHEIFQSTPPRGGRLPAQPPPLWPGVISIHAPARGATAKMHSFTCGSLTNK